MNESAPTPRERKIERVGFNKANYPVYERKLVTLDESEPDIPDGNLDTHERLDLRGVLNSILIAGMTLVPMKTGDVDYSVEQHPEETVVVQDYSELESLEKSVFGEEVDFIKAGLEMRVDNDEMIEYADKPVVGALEYSRKEYVSEQIVFKDFVPLTIQTEIRRLMPGLCAQESRFDASRVSRSGAKGIMQFMPETWQEYGGEEGEHLSLKKQVEVAGDFLSDLYTQLEAHIGQIELTKLRSRFHSEESFEKNLMVPLILNSYNAGAARVSEAVRLYIETTEVSKLPNGNELFTNIIDFGKESKAGKYLDEFRKDTREYVPLIYAQASLLEETRPQDASIASR